jgi:hypothetical protein
MNWTEYSNWWTLSAEDNRVARLYKPDSDHLYWEVTITQDEFKSPITDVKLARDLALDEAKAVVQTLLGALA